MNNNIITIVKGDYGIVQNLNIINGTPSEEDSFLVTIKDINRVTMVSKKYSNVIDHIPFSLTEEESNKLKATTYYYTVDWYRDNVFLKNLVNGERFIVKKKV